MGEKERGQVGRRFQVDGDSGRALGEEASLICETLICFQPSILAAPGRSPSRELQSV
jgi:hypothetical protein